MHDASRKARKRPFSGSAGAEEIALQQTGEEFLRQVLGLVGRVPAAADIGVERIPVDFTELRKGLMRLGGRPVAGGDDQAPPGRSEAARVDRDGAGCCGSADMGVF